MNITVELQVYFEIESDTPQLDKAIMDKLIKIHDIIKHMELEHSLEADFKLEIDIEK